MKIIGCLLLCFLSACTLPAETVFPPVAPPETTTVFLSSPVECVDVLQLPSREFPPAWTTPAVKRLPQSRVLTPQQVVATAQQQARVTPEARGYFGGSAEYTYTWQPGKVYVVFLSPKAPTVIILPPGERTVAAMYVDKDAYEVTTTRAGRDLAAYDTITIRPLTDKGELDAFILTESSRRYLLHFITGPTGMLAVTFETSAVGEVAAKAPALVFPKPLP